MNDPATLHHRSVYAEDLRVGQVMNLDTYTVSEEEILDFATQWDPQWFHTDKEAAESGVFGGLIGSGVHTLAICQKLVVASTFDRWNVIAGKSMRDIQFLRPLRPGDTVTGTLSIDNVVLDHRSRGLVTTTARLEDSNGKHMFQVVTEAYLHCRPTPRPPR